MSELETRMASLQAMTSEELWKYLDEVNLLDDMMKKVLNVVRTETMALQRMKLNIRGEVPAGIPYAKLTPDLTGDDPFNPPFDVSGMTADDVKMELHDALTSGDSEALEMMAVQLTPRQAARLKPADDNDPWDQLSRAGRTAEAAAMRLIVAAVADGRLPMKHRTMALDAAVVNMLAHLRDATPTDLLEGLEDQDVANGATMGLLGNVTSIKTFRDAIAKQLKQDGTELIDDLGDDVDPETTYVAISTTDEKAHARVVDRDLIAGLLWANVHLDTQLHHNLFTKRDHTLAEMFEEAGFKDLQRIVIGKDDQTVHVYTNGTVVKAENASLVNPLAKRENEDEDDGSSMMDEIFKTISEAVSIGKIGKVMGADGREIDVDNLRRNQKIKERVFADAPLKSPGNEDLLIPLGNDIDADVNPTTEREAIIILRKGWLNVERASANELLAAVEETDRMNELVGLFKFESDDVEVRPDGTRWFHEGRLAKNAELKGREYMFTGDGWEVPTPMTTDEAADHVKRMVIGENDDSLLTLDDRSFRLEMAGDLAIAMLEQFAPSAAKLLTDADS